VLVLTLVIASSVRTVATKPIPSMVQMVDGKSISVEPVDHNQRTPEVIKDFIKTNLQLMFSWNNKLPANTADGQVATVNDPGVQVGNSRVTTAAWQASFTLSDDFRGTYLAALGQLTPSSVFSGNAQSVLNIVSLSEPKPVKDGVWQVDMVATLLIFTSSKQQGTPISFNKSIFVQSVEPNTDPLPENSTPLQKAVYRVRQSGLQITEMRDLSIDQLNNSTQ